MSDGHPHAELRHERSPYASRVRAMETLLVEKGVLTEAEIQDRIEYMESRSPTARSSSPAPGRLLSSKFAFSPMLNPPQENSASTRCTRRSL